MKRSETPENEMHVRNVAQTRSDATGDRVTPPRPQP